MARSDATGVSGAGGSAAPVRTTIADGVAIVEVDNPPVNALDDATLTALRQAAESLADDAEVRAVVVTGCGDRAFLAGADLRSLSHALATPGAMEEHVALTRPTFDAWRALPQPLVAAVVGNAVGGGLEFALLADVIVADPRVRLGLPEVTLGLIPGAGGTQRLPRRIGPAALPLLLLGQVLRAARAYELGLVDVIAAEGEARTEARALAARLAALPPAAVRSAKAAARHALDATLDTGLDHERDLFLTVAATADAREGVAAFLEKREPRFGHA